VNWIQRFITAIATHKADAAAHHAKTTGANELTSGALNSIDRLPALTTNKIWKGTANRPAEVDLPAGLDIFDKFREFIPWVSLDGFSADGDTGYVIAVEGSTIRIQTGTTTDYDAYVKTLHEWIKLQDTGKIITTEFIIQRLYSTVNQNIWLRFCGGVLDPPSETISHYGWKIIGGDLYASNADGTTQTITDTTVNLTAEDQRTRLKIVFNPRTTCKFYVNDVLKVTHDTNLCWSANHHLELQIRTLENAFKYIHLARVLIEKEY